MNPILFRGVACHVRRSCASGCLCSFATGRVVSGSNVQALGLLMFLFS